MKIHWTKALNGAFSTAANWSGGVVPGASADAYIDATGASFTVTSSGTVSVLGIDTSANATLVVGASTSFTATNGSDGGVNGGRIIVDNAADFVFGGSMDNNGEIVVLSGGAQTGLYVTAAGATLSGGGQVLLGDNPANVITALGKGAATLTNLDNTLSGAGVIGVDPSNGADSLTLINEEKGVIDANGITALTISVGANGTVTNAGVIEATGAGGLNFGDETDINYREFISNAGTITSTGDGGFVLNNTVIDNVGVGVFSGGAAEIVLHYGRVAGGALIINSGETLSVDQGTLGDVSGTALTNNGTIAVSNSAYLVVQNTVTNAGIVQLQSHGFQSSLYIAPLGATLTGGGQLTMSDNPYNVITSSDSGAATLTNVNNTISGAGIIGENPYALGSYLKLVNEANGVIDASGVNRLTIDGGSPGSVINAGTIEATGSGGLVLDKGSIINTGTIQNLGTGDLLLQGARVNDSGGGVFSGGSAELIFQNATITGGSLTIDAGEMMLVNALDTADVSGVVFANEGTVVIQNDGSMSMQNAVFNSGVIDVVSTINETHLFAGNNGVTLTGGGEINLGDTRYGDLGGGYAAFDNIDNTIVGAGTMQFLQLINQMKGVIDASGVNAMTIDALAQTAANAGLIEVTGAGGIVLQDGTFANTGVIKDAGTGAVVLSDASLIDSGGGVLSGGTADLVLQGATVSGGAVVISTGGALLARSASDVSGASLANHGAVIVGDKASLVVAGDIANEGVIQVAAISGATSLDVGAAGARLSGGGQIVLGDNAYNAITAEVAGATMLTNVDNTLSGAGTIGADPGEPMNGLTLVNETAGLVDANGFNVLALDADGASSIVNGGTLEATGAGGLLIEGGSVLGTGGVILAGAGSAVTISGAVVTGGALDTGAGGLIALLGASTVTASGTLTNAGIVAVGGASTLILGGATVNGGATGAIAVASGSKVSLAGATIVGGTLTTAGAGRIATAGGGNLFDGSAQAVANAGALTIADESSLAVQGAIINSGKVSLAARKGATELIVQATGATFSGRGAISLADSVFSEITGVAGNATLINVDNRITGSGLIGGGTMTLINRTKGVIDATGAKVALTLNTGAATIANAGTIEAAGAAGGLVTSAVANTGILEAAGGDLAIQGAVTGGGSAVISAGTLSFGSSFGENVSFTGASGALVLAQSQAYAGQISGFSLSGATSLDLEDIAFGGATKSSYSGTTASGVLMVTDGIHTAHIALVGNYTASSFTTSSDGRGGTVVVDPSRAAATQAFAAAASILGGGRACTTAATPQAAAPAQPLVLASPIRA